MYVVLQTSQIQMNTSGKHFPSMGKAPTANKKYQNNIQQNIFVFFLQKGKNDTPKYI